MQVASPLVLPYKKCPVDTLRQKKSPNLSVEALCLRYLVSRLGGATGAPPEAEKATGASGSGRKNRGSA